MAGFCVAALEEALARFGKPEIFNTDQGSQFTSFAFTTVLREADVRISMDGRGRWMDNVFIERLWRSLKYECAYLNRSEEHTSELQSLMRISYAVFCLKKKKSTSTKTKIEYAYIIHSFCNKKTTPQTIHQRE